ncbi:bestrophin family protein [Pseudomonas sp. PDM16]|uniref:bestrophin family protein n=1 Tax=Pseudomonas sp. PDM16 TaxID=2769292 RepID=UPI001782E668|nr:bestrophin family protein [Pseudomonas sp. PDM16]MBD9416403.1 bestrophin family protein [Pseudomonas sp. PDM16]
MIIYPQRTSLWTLLFSIKGSIIPVIWKKVMYTVLLSSLVVASRGLLNDHHMLLTATPFTLWGLTLAIFLAFRNTVAYQRFWEARTLWGELLIVARNLARQSMILLPELNRESRLSLARPLIGFAHALRDMLRGQPASDDTRRILSGDPHPLPSQPNVLLGVLGRRFMEQARSTSASDVVMVEIDQQLTRLSYVLGGCERIKNTPIPYPYILMLHRVVHIYCFLLPFCLVGSLGWFTPVAVCVLAYTFFGLDALGDQIADPFDTQPNDLPLDAICRTIEISALELLGEPTPAPLEPVGNVQL